MLAEKAAPLFTMHAEFTLGAAQLPAESAKAPALVDNHLARVESFEDQIRKLPPVDLDLVHHFSKDVYARELHIPKGTVLTGHIHKHANLNILSKGELSIVTENGVIRVKAPYTVVSPPGTKRLAYAHEDTVWTTIHGTPETDIEKIEETFIAHSVDEYHEFLALTAKE